MLDLDSDNDSIPDIAETGPLGVTLDSNFDGVVDTLVDADDDGRHDTFITFPILDTDGDSVPDYVDLDSDNDGITDLLEHGGDDPNGTGQIQLPLNDADNNGFHDDFVGVALIDSDGDGIFNNQDLDSDNDGIPDVVEAANYDADSDFDGMVDPFLDANSNGLNDALEGVTVTLQDFDSDSVPDYIDVDSDNDGIPDTVEFHGSNIVDTTDANNNGWFDQDENQSAFADQDGDSIPNVHDLDSDSDGIPDIVEAGGSDPNNNGTVDPLVDTDGNGFHDDFETNALPIPDTDGDGIQDFLDLDSDNDLIPDVVEAGGIDAGNGQYDSAGDANQNGLADYLEGNALPIPDTDGDGIVDMLDLDSDNDSIPDIAETGPLGVTLDSNFDGVVDTLVDADDDGRHDTFITFPILDTDGDSVPDYVDLDSDNDGITDLLEHGGDDPNGTGQIQLPLNDADNNGFHDDFVGVALIDSDGDGIFNNQDLDSDNDGIPDVVEAANYDADSDFDGMVDPFLDANSNGLNDALEGVTVTLQDFDSDSVPDYIDVDSDNDGIPDTVEFHGSNIVDTTDANNNGWFDQDENQSAFADQDGDSIPNVHDLDSDSDGIPDIVEAGGSDPNNNGTVDPLVDTDGNGFHDDFETNALPIPDTDGDGIQDFLDLDSDNDSIFDVIESGNVDEDGDGRIDNPATNNFLPVPDTDSDGVPDHLDLDSDNDTLGDLFESGRPFLTVDPDNDGVLGLTDSDGDGISDSIDNLNGFGTQNYPPPSNTVPGTPPNYINPDSDGDGIFDINEFLAEGTSPLDGTNDGMIDDNTDSDGDGIADVIDFIPGEFGGIIVPSDTDGDGVLDSLDGDIDNDGILNINEGTGDSDGDGILDVFDLDSDNDGIPDIVESGNIDSNNDGVVDDFIDEDQDGVDDNIQAVGGSAPDSDNDGVPDQIDLDSDNDGIPDIQETGFSGLVSGGQVGSFVDANGNGRPDIFEGPNVSSSVIDTDGDNVPDYLDLDSDNDGIVDLIEAGGQDSIMDGQVDNFFEAPATANGWDDRIEANPLPLPDSDGDGQLNFQDLDSDNDSIPDVVENGLLDTNGDYLIDDFTDANGDGLDDTFAGFPIAPIHSDNDGIPDYLDLDSDNDSISDLIEGNLVVDIAAADSNNDGVLNLNDSDGDGISDAVDNSPNFGSINGRPINLAYTLVDSNGDGIPDIVEFRPDLDLSVVDANQDGVVDGNADVDQDGIIDLVDDNTNAFGGLSRPTVPASSSPTPPPSPSRLASSTVTNVPTTVPTQAPSSVVPPSPSISRSAATVAPPSVSSAAPSPSGAPAGNPVVIGNGTPKPDPTVVRPDLGTTSAEISVQLDCAGVICSELEVMSFIDQIDAFSNAENIIIVSLDGNILSFIICESNVIPYLIQELSTSQPNPPFTDFASVNLLSVDYDVSCGDNYWQDLFEPESESGSFSLHANVSLYIVLICAVFFSGLF